MVEDVSGQGNIPWIERINVEEASKAEVMMIRDNLLKFAKDNFSYNINERLCQRVQRS